MSSCLLPTIQILQPTTTNPVLRPKLTRGKSQPINHSERRRKKIYPTSPSGLSLSSRFPKMRLATIRNSALFSVLGLTSAQSTASTWAQTQPFNVDVSTDSLLSSSQQALTNIVGTNTPSTTTLPPAVSVTDSFSASIPTELSTISQGSGTSVVTVTPSSGSSASASAESSRSASASAASSRASSSASIPSGAAAPAGVAVQQKVMGVAGVLAGAAGVLFV